jgi:hypothetical protein
MGKGTAFHSAEENEPTREAARNLSHERQHSEAIKYDYCEKEQLDSHALVLV